MPKRTTRFATDLKPGDLGFYPAFKAVLDKVGPGGMVEVTREQFNGMTHCYSLGLDASRIVIEDDADPYVPYAGKPLVPPLGSEKARERAEIAMRELGLDPAEMLTKPPEPGGITRVDLERVREVGFARALEEANKPIHPDRPMRVSGGMQGGQTPQKFNPYGDRPFTQWDELFKRAQAEAQNVYSAPGLDPSRGLTPPPPTPGWLVDREKEAGELNEASVRKALSQIAKERQTAAEARAIAEQCLSPAFAAGLDTQKERDVRHKTLSVNYAILERDFVAAQHRIVELEKRLAAADEMEHPKPVNDTEKRVNDMIDDLSARKVSPPDRARLRGAIDKADKPLAGRAGQDEGLGRAIGRTSGWRPL